MPIVAEDSLKCLADLLEGQILLFLSGGGRPSVELGRLWFSGVAETVFVCTIGLRRHWLFPIEQRSVRAQPKTDHGRGQPEVPP